MKITDMKKVFILATFTLLPSLVSAATLSVLPASQNVTIGDTFSITVNLDTKNSLVDGVDLVYLNYNPVLLEVQDASTTVVGVQIAPGNLLSSTFTNIVNPNLGRITFSQIAVDGNKYNGSGTLATITFKALAVGSANVALDFTLDSTIDSNVALGGSDILTGVFNGTYVISNPPPPAPVTPPAPTGGGGGGGGGGGSISSGGGSTVVNVPVVTNSTSTIQSTIKTALKITRWLTVGSSGSDVSQLQKALNQNGYIIASTGLGALNNESTYFGPTTAAAVARFQCAKLQVCQGAPATTGYGATGPRTRQALSLLTMLTYASSTAPIVAGCPVGMTCTPITNQVPISTSTSTPTINISAFTRSLTLGSTGTDVKNLQIFLNAKGFTVSTIGAGSKGQETTYFGPATKMAVIKFQLANSITPAVGYFGPVTRSYVK